MNGNERNMQQQVSVGGDITISVQCYIKAAICFLLTHGEFSNGYVVKVTHLSNFLYKTVDKHAISSVKAKWGMLGIFQMFPVLFSIQRIPKHETVALLCMQDQGLVMFVTRGDEQMNHRYLALCQLDELEESIINTIINTTINCDEIQYSRLLNICIEREILFADTNRF